MRILSVVCATLLLSQSVSAELTGHWPLNDGAGAVAANLVAGGADGEIFNADSGGPTDGSVWVEDASRGTVIGFGGQAPFDTAFVRTAKLPLMTLENDFTWAFWANQDEGIADDPGQFAGIVGNRYNEDGTRADYDPRQFIKFTPTGFEYHMNGNGDDNLAYSADETLNNVTPGVWQHHAMVKDGANLTYYRDGAELNAGTIAQPQSEQMTLWLGGDFNGDAVENWQGLLSDVRTYDHALSGADVAALVPEPSSMTLICLGLLSGLGFVRRK